VAGQSPKKSLGPIPTSLENAGLADKMILRMRDDEGRNWGDITKAWMTMTGIKVGNSTLRMRYTTMKANFVEISGEDVCYFLSLFLFSVFRESEDMAWLGTVDNLILITTNRKRDFSV
jgi:hypothetical protein